MTPELARGYLIGRMAEMGITAYYIKTRHLVLTPKEVRTEEAPTQFFVLAEPKENIRIESSTGIFDIAETGANELQYEHQGIITLTNYSSLTQHVILLQAIFKTR